MQETVTVTGIRASVEKSLETKRNSDSLVEVITAEDIGKMPDKNVADAVSRVPGVTISSQSGGSGGFDENDRVSMRGTNPSLTQTLLLGNGVRQPRREMARYRSPHLDRQDRDRHGGCRAAPATNRPFRCRK